MRKDFQQVKKKSGGNNSKGYKNREVYEDKEELASTSESGGLREDQVWWSPSLLFPAVMECK
jgi:hypothetical protein